MGRALQDRRHDALAFTLVRTLPAMNPRWLFPVLAAAFALAALLRWLRLRRIDPAVRSWGLLALMFGLVSAWLWAAAGR